MDGVSWGFLEESEEDIPAHILMDTGYSQQRKLLPRRGIEPRKWQL